MAVDVIKAPSVAVAVESKVSTTDFVISLFCIYLLKLIAKLNP